MKYVFLCLLKLFVRLFINLLRVGQIIKPDHFRIMEKCDFLVFCTNRMEFKWRFYLENGFITFLKLCWNTFICLQFSWSVCRSLTGFGMRRLSLKFLSKEMYDIFKVWKCCLGYFFSLVRKKVLDISFSRGLMHKFLMKIKIIRGF